MDANGSGIVKVPRLPVDDNASTEVLVYRNLWSQIGADLPKRASARKVANWVIPPTLEGALQSLDSRQLESGEAMTDDFKNAVGHEIEQFKRELRQRNQSSIDV